MDSTFIEALLDFCPDLGVSRHNRPERQRKPQYRKRGDLPKYARPCNSIYELNFAVNLNLAAGTVFNFAPDATPNDPATCVDGGDASGCFYVHATNAALAGTTQQGSDNQYINFDSTNTTNGDPLYIDSNGDGWDKSSDINVRVYGTVVPEPSTAALIIVGTGALLVRRRKR